MEITKEYFDRLVKTLATKSDLENLATKSDLRDLERKVVARVDDSQEQLAQMTKRGFDDIATRLDVTKKVVELEQQMHEVRLELNLA